MEVLFSSVLLQANDQSKSFYMATLGNRFSFLYSLVSTRRIMHRLWKFGSANILPCTYPYIRNAGLVSASYFHLWFQSDLGSAWLSSVIPPGCLSDTTVNFRGKRARGYHRLIQNPVSGKIFLAGNFLAVKVLPAAVKENKDRCFSRITQA